MTEDRLTRIESLLSHQEKQIQDLSEMTAQQWKEIDRLKRSLSMTQKQLQALETSGGESKTAGANSVAEFAALEKPPHY
jgi:uncharacterized coiled-coil protein SlyX